VLEIVLLIFFKLYLDQLFILVLK